MNNIITVTIEFYFKGIKFTPSLRIELDTYLQSTGCIPNLYPLIANENNIDLYSYEYEMMQAETIKTSQAEGLVENYVVNGILDHQAFEMAWREHKMLTQLQDIAKSHMAIDALDQHPGLEKALREAYKLGKNNT